MDDVDLRSLIAHVDIIKHKMPDGTIKRWAIIHTNNGLMISGAPAVAECHCDHDAVKEQQAVDAACAELSQLMDYIRDYQHGY